MPDARRGRFVGTPRHNQDRPGSDHSPPQGKDRHHVCGNLSVNSPQRGQIEATAVGGVPPTQQKFGRPSALSGIRLRYSYEPL